MDISELSASELANYNSYKELGCFTEEEIEDLMEADAIADTLEILPDDVEAFVKKLDSDLPEDVSDTANKVGELANTNPEYAKQIMAFVSLLYDDTPAPAAEGVQKVSKSQLNKAKAQNIVDNIINKQ